MGADGYLTRAAFTAARTSSADAAQYTFADDRGTPLHPRRFKATHRHPRTAPVATAHLLGPSWLPPLIPWSMMNTGASSGRSHAAGMFAAVTARDAPSSGVVGGRAGGVNRALTSQSRPTCPPSAHRTSCRSYSRKIVNIRPYPIKVCAWVLVHHFGSSYSRRRLGHRAQELAGQSLAAVHDERDALTRILPRATHRSASRRIAVDPSASAASVRARRD